MLGVILSIGVPTALCFTGIGSNTQMGTATRRGPRSGDKLLCDPNKFAQAFSQFYCEFAALAHVPRD